MREQSLDAIFDKLEGVQRRPTWPFLLAAVALAAIAGVFAGPPEASPPAGTVAYALGGAFFKSLLIGLAVWVGLYFFFVRRRNPDAGPVHYLILAVVAFVPQASLGVLAAGAGIERRVAEGYLNEQVEVANATRVAYDSEIEASGIDGIFLPAELAADPGLLRTRAKLARATEATHNYKTAFEEQARRRRAEIARLPLSEKGRRSLREFVAREDRVGVDAVARATTRDLAILAEYRAALEILAHGNWRVVDGKVMFAREADLKTFAARLAAVRRLTAEPTQPAPKAASSAPVSA